MKESIYFDEKLKRRRRRAFKIKIYSGVALFLLLIISAGYLIAYSPLFRVKDISMSTTSDIVNVGVQKIKDDIKIFFAEQSKIAGFLGPENILIWQPKKIPEFLKSYPQILELNIEKDYFERTIKIAVKPRKKYGVWCMTRTEEDNARNDTNNLPPQPALNLCRWFDENGVLFGETPLVEGALINKVNDFTGRQLATGDKVLGQRFLNNLLKIFDVLEKTDLGTGFLRLENLDLQEIIFDSPEDFKIYFSLRIDPGFAVPGIKSLKEIGLEKMDYIDFRVENRVYYKLK